jgi:hypothetical protein
VVESEIDKHETAENFKRVDGQETIETSVETAFKCEPELEIIDVGYGMLAGEKGIEDGPNLMGSL